MNRRKFIRNTSFLTAGLSLVGSASSQNTANYTKSFSLLKPKALKKGDTIGVIAPGGAVFNSEDIEKCRKKLNDLGFKMVEGRTLHTQHGYLSDTDENRAEDLLNMFADANIDGILAIRGGSGCARLLPFLDYNLIRKNLKPFIGMSDITALLNAFYTQAGIVSFHGPVGVSTWEGFTWNYFKPTVMDGIQTKMQIPSDNNLFYTIHPGIAEGELIGGNLTVFSQLVGSKYLPDMQSKILLLEEIKEEPYYIDRLLTQLELAGIFKQIKGIVIGECRKCIPEEADKSLTLKEMLIEKLSHLGIPVFYGAKFGHIKDKWTLPIGIKARIDADKGSITLLETAVNL